MGYQTRLIPPGSIELTPIDTLKEALQTKMVDNFARKNSGLRCGHIEGMAFFLEGCQHFRNALIDFILK